jgi:hypothetical protein
MRTRLIAPLAVLFLVLAGAATAAAATGVFEKNDSGLDSPRDLAERGTGVTTPTGATTPTSVSLPDTSLPQTTLPADGADALPVGETQTFAASNAGSVTVRRDGSTLTVISANANAGFVSEVERGTGTEVEVQFADGSVRVDFNAELEDGAVRVRVRVSGVAVDNPGTTPTTAPATTTIPANDDNVDNSGPGNAHEGEDNSGPGNSHDGGDDDNSGSGSSGSGNSGSGHSGSGH